MKSPYLLLILLSSLLFACKSDNSKKLFELLDNDDTGVEFKNLVDEDELNNVLQYGYFYNGGGVAAGDFNNDGFVDLYFTGNMVADKLYLNKGKAGEIAFEDVTQEANIKHSGWKTGVSLVDINADGWLDIYICRSGAEDPNLRENLLYINESKETGTLKFAEKAKEYGLNDNSYTTQAAFFDYDRDGDLDCYLLNHSIQQYAGFSAALPKLKLQSDDRFGSKLLRNDGNNTFTNVTQEAGIVNNILSFGLGINIADLNNDGWQDIYISNDYNENDYLYINQADGTFVESIKEQMGHTSLFSMGTDAADINNDGLIDILSLDMQPEQLDRIKITSGDDNYDKYMMLVNAGFHHQSMRNMLQINQGNHFSEVGQLAGISNTDWSWSALFADFDNDGLKDLFVSNGYARDYTNMEFLKFSVDAQVSAQKGKSMPSTMDIIEEMPPIDQANFIFKNIDGLQFKKQNEEWGIDQLSQSNGAIYADLDNDGDLDIVVNNINQKAFIHRNNSMDAKYLKVNLKSKNPAFSIGAKITVWSGNTVQYQIFQPVRGFQSAMYTPVHFGFGQNTKIDSLSIQWANGAMQILNQIEMNSSIEIDYEQSSLAVPNATNLNVAAIFSPINNIDFVHSQQLINDFKIQPLLPEMQSYTGPCMTTADVNNDGKLDLLIGGGKYQATSIFINTSNGFQKSPQEAFEKDKAFNDGDAVFFDADGDNDLDLVISSYEYEPLSTDSLLQTRLYLNTNGKFKRSDGIANIKLNAKSLAIADINGDGYLDIFIGSHCKPGRFPEPMPSMVLLNNGKGSFKQDPSFKLNGLVNKAIFTDLNNDSKPDLVVAGEWMQLLTFMNVKKELKAQNNELPSVLAHSMVMLDVDNDGDQDFIIGNEGLNSQYNITSSNGLGMYYGDFSNLGNVVPVLTLKNDKAAYPYASRDELLDQIPSLKNKFENYTKYSKASISEVIEEKLLNKMGQLSVSEMRSGILRNNGGKLTFEPLPLTAQMSPIYAITVLPKGDLILSGNRTFTRVRMGKIDANYGQYFTKDPNNNYQLIPQKESGLYLKGDVRSSVYIDDQVIFGINSGSAQSYRF